MAVAKVFTINLTGGQAVQKNFDTINKSVKDTTVQVNALKEQLAAIEKVNSSDSAIAGLKIQIKELELAQKSLSATQKAAENDIKQQILLEKGLADVKLKEAQATKVQAQADAVRTASQIQQQKELDRQINQEVREEAQLKKTAAAANALPQSYNAIRNALNQLRPLIQGANANSLLTFQGKQINFSQGIEEYKRLSAAEQAFRRQFQADGVLVGEYTTGIVNAFKNLHIDDLLTKNVQGAKEQVGQLTTKTQELVVAYRKAQTEGGQDLNKLQQEIHANVTETQNLKLAIANAEGQLRGIGGVGGQITESISSGFKNLKNSLAQFALSYLGFQALFSSIQGGVQNVHELSDSTSQLEVELGKAEGGAAGLIDQLAKINTRTKLTGLEDIANIAAKAGVSEKNLVGVTAAIDKIKVAFGKDFGDVETGTESLVKIINIFEGANNVTGDNLLRTGNAIRTLANESVASVPFLTDFTKRMAGLKGISDISLPSVLGLASGFEQFGQSAEVSSTSLVRIIPKLATDTEKFSAIAGVTKKEFEDLLKSNPAEALLKVAQGFSAGKSSIVEFEESFKGSGLGSGRVSSVIGVLGKNTEAFRASIDSAGQSFNSTSNIEEAFTRKNENLASVLDKISKKFADAANSTAFKTTIAAISSVILLLLTHIPLLLTILGVLSVAWAVQNTQLIALNLQLLYYNARILLNYTAIGLLTVAMSLNRVAILLLNGAVTLATKGFQLLGIAMRGTPFGVIVAIIGTLAGLFIGLQHAMAATTGELKNQALRLKAIQEIQEEATRAIADQVAKLQGYAAVVRDTSISEQTRLKALQDLIAINPEFSKALQGNKIDISAVNEVLKEYNGNLLRKAELEAAQSLQQKEFQKLVDLQQQKQSLEIAKAQGTGFGDLTDEQRGLFSKLTTSVGRTAFTSDLFNTKISSSDFQEAFTDLDKQIKQQSSVLDATTQVFKDKYQKVAEVVKTGSATVAVAASPEQFDIDVEAMKKQLQALDDQIDKFKGTQKDLNVLIKQRSDLQDKLDAALGITHGGGQARGKHGSRLTADQSDFFKDIDAIRDQQLAEENLRHEQGLDDEKTFLNKILAINEDALNKKIAHLTGANAQERKLIAEFQLEKINLEKQTNQKLFDIDNKTLEGGLQQKNIGAKTTQDIALSNPDLTNTQRVQLQEDYLNQTLTNQIKFNQDQENLEKQYGIHSIDNENKRKEAIAKIIDEIIIKRRSEPEAALKDIQETGDKAAEAIKTSLAKQISAILDQNLSPTATAKKIQAAQVSAQESILANQVATDKISLDKTKELLSKKLVSQKQYYDALEKYQTDQAALDQLTTNQQLSNIQKLTLAIKEFASTFVSGLIGIKQYTNDAAGNAQRIKDVIADVQKNISQAATEAYNNYFKNQADQIDRETKAQEDFLDRQRQRVLATAESQAEQDTINRQYDQKKLDADKKAFEAKKKLALKQATIDFALAAIKTFATYGWPLGLIAVAGLAIAYAVQRSAINAQQFAKGGQVKNLSSGKITGTPNISMSNGDNMLATVRTGEVILNQRHQAALGGARTFAAIGVPGFAGSGQLGTSLRAPQFVSSGSTFQNAAGDASDRMDQLMKITEGVLSAVYATDRKPVTLVPDKVTRAQSRTRKDVSIATI